MTAINNNDAWRLRSTPDQNTRELGESLGLTSVGAGILASRLPGATKEELRKFLYPSLSDLYDPTVLKDMDKAAARVAQAISRGQQVTIYGDYDADGVTASALMMILLTALGCRATYYLPSRLEEGYGISREFVRTAADNGTDLVVTVDCGTHEHEALAALKEQGIDVVVTDHHEQGDAPLPDAIAVVNPKRQDETYPFRELTGVGVAFKWAWQTCRVFTGQTKLPPRLSDTLLRLLPFVAIGTIADLGPLISENRVYAAFGLKQQGNAGPGLTALLKKCGAGMNGLTPHDVAFIIAPRLNAAGRMGDADLALSLLLADTEEDAEDFARRLDHENELRKALCQSITNDAREVVKAEYDEEEIPALVVAREKWHEGVIGIVASRLVDEFSCPAVVISLDSNGQGRGSARGIPGVNIFEAMQRSIGRFLSFGGHEQAAGFSIRQDEIPAFREEFQAECKRQRAAMPNGTTPLDIDMELPLTAVNEVLLNDLERLAPFGSENSGNPTPLFLARGVDLVGEIRLLGRKRNNRNFTINARQNGVILRAVAFNHQDWISQIDLGLRHCDIVYRVSRSLNTSRPEIHLVDIRATKK